MRKELSARWRDLVSAIEEECWHNNQNPGGGVLIIEESELKVSLPIGTVRFARYFKEQEVLEGDHRELARRYYEEYKAARAEEEANGGKQRTL